MAARIRRRARAGKVELRPFSAPGRQDLREHLLEAPVTGQDSVVVDIEDHRTARGLGEGQHLLGVEAAIVVFQSQAAGDGRRDEGEVCEKAGLRGAGIAVTPPHVQDETGIGEPHGQEELVMIGQVP